MEIETYTMPSLEITPIVDTDTVGESSGKDQGTGTVVPTPPRT